MTIREVVALVFIVASLNLWFAIREGRRLAREREEDPDFKHHVDLVNRAIVTLLIAVGVVEWYIHSGVSHGIRWTPLFIVHLPCAVGSLLLLVVLRFWMTGVRSAYHRHVAYSFCALYSVALITGGFLLYGKH